MVTAFRQRVTVQPGGLVEVRSPDLPPGQEAEVIVLWEPPAAVPATAARRTLASFIGSGKGLFTSAADIDAYVRELRDEWDH